MLAGPGDSDRSRRHRRKDDPVQGKGRSRSPVERYGIYLTEHVD